MESRPEQGVVRRLMWEAAAVGASGDGAKKEAAVAFAEPARQRAPATDARTPREGPGSRTRTCRTGMPLSSQIQVAQPSRASRPRARRPASPRSPVKPRD